MSQHTSLGRQEIREYTQKLAAESSRKRGELASQARGIKKERGQLLDLGRK